MKGNSAVPGGSSKSKPTWWNAPRVFRYVGFFSPSPSFRKEPNMITWLPRWFALLVMLLPFVPVAGFLDLPGQEEKVPGDKDKQPEGKNSTAADEALLKIADYKVDDPGLLEFF